MQNFFPKGSFFIKSISILLSVVILLTPAFATKLQNLPNRPDISPQLQKEKPIPPLIIAMGIGAALFAGGYTVYTLVWGGGPSAWDRDECISWAIGGAAHGLVFFLTELYSSSVLLHVFGTISITAIELELHDEITDAVRNAMQGIQSASDATFENIKASIEASSADIESALSQILTDLNNASGGPPPPPSFNGYWADFSTETIQTDGMTIQTHDMEYNSYYGASWRMLTPGSSYLVGTFYVSSVPSGVMVTLVHLSSAAQGVPGGGYSPVDVIINGQLFLDNYDVAENHGGSHSYETDSWQIADYLHAGTNNIRIEFEDDPWAYTHYWIQNIVITPGSNDLIPPDCSILFPNGGEQLSGIFSVSATANDNTSGVEYVEFQYSTDHSNWFGLVGPDSPDGKDWYGANGWVLRFDTEDAGITVDNSVWVRARAADKAGNLSDWDECDNYFSVDNSGNPPSSISVTENLNPNPCNPYQSVTVSGNAYYNTGSPVTNTTTTIEIVQTGATWTTPLDNNGNYNRGITAPSSPASYTVKVTVADGTLQGSTSRTLNVQSGGDGNNYDFVRSTTCKDMQSSSPFDPIDETEFFRSNDARVYVWLHFSNVYLNSDPPPLVRIKWMFYQPDGSLYLTSTYDIPDPDPYDYWEWYKCWAYIYIYGYSAADLEGRWSCKIYVDEGSGYKYLTTEGFTIRYEFDQHIMAQDVQDWDPWEPINPTNTFYQSDEKALTWARLDNVTEGLEVKWEFYEPNGQLYGSYVLDPPIEDPGSGYYYSWVKLWGWIWVNGYAAANKTGDWHVNVFIKDYLNSWDLEYTDYFQILESPNVSPVISVEASPDVVIEGNSFNLLVMASDNTYLQNLELSWNDGSQHTNSYSNLYTSSFSTSYTIGPYVEGTRVEYYGKAFDASGNWLESLHKTLIIRDSDIRGPTVSDVLIQEHDGDGDGTLEDNEEVKISWGLSDPSGVSFSKLVIDGDSIAVQGSYYGIAGPYAQGFHSFTIIATDADQSPATTEYRDRFEVSSATGITPDDQHDNLKEPTRFALFQNYPNPFNPETEINYDLPHDAYVNLTILNILSQKVKTLVDEFQHAGHKTIHWDGKDDQGEQVTSGVYFYRLDAGDFTQTRKMVLMK